MLGVACLCVCVCVCVKHFGLEMQKERAVSRKWRTRLRGLVKGSFLDGGTVLLNETFPPWAAAAPWIGTDGSSGGGSFCFLATRVALRNNLRSGEDWDRWRILLRQPSPPFSSLPRASSDFFWDPRWGRSKNFWKRRARETWPPWRSFYPGSDRPLALAAVRLGPGEAAPAADTEPPLIPSPVCSGRLWNREIQSDITEWETASSVDPIK